MTRRRDENVHDPEELLDLADETRRLIARFRVDDDDPWRESVNKALLVALKGQQAILEALAGLDRSARATPAAPPPEPLAAAVPAPAAPGADTVSGTYARQVVCEFDQRDRSFDRGLSKLNAWLSSGRGGLPFQKRDDHAYLNTGANSDAMIARIEVELMGREGYGKRLGRLVIEGLEGDVVIYARTGAPT